ncbi:hypothetical protein LIER_30506 [Lithospermum erythrorhizon]|uniref:Uncharacterized protein n=1 Tax=Lithospermum erythrorhizon TaxID=34254 RepID=A0AAV3RQZ8_LITER
MYIQTRKEGWTLVCRKKRRIPNKSRQTLPKTKTIKKHFNKRRLLTYHPIHTSQEVKPIFLKRASPITLRDFIPKRFWGDNEPESCDHIYEEEEGTSSKEEVKEETP